MAYFEIMYYVHDETNQGVVYKLKDKEAKEMVKCGRGKLWDNATNKRVETPIEWLDVVEENEPQEVESDGWIQTLGQLQKLYVEKFGKQLSFKYQNDVEWIKSKLYS